jgi:transposase
MNKINEIQQLIISKGFRLLFLPPYSPQLNPIEEVFSKWKEFIKSKNSRTSEELVDYIHQTKNFITIEEFGNYFSHMKSFILRALRREEY